ncbi:S41 family peptidase [Tessaracoccus lacteus]|uniref:Tricorn protease homolog n=1 Tax=Tessaracoccus lacteus TaxID=3041766 RepID=A0ABY8PVC9_9ACTN|nr:S41 family peptidase [Tessaracoccus sp. T21]WGT46332.1 S41 family peptidase [Tessaracoccus sp. T21]
MAYSRYPHLHRDKVVFVADEDLWMGDLGGGRAARITMGESTPVNPRFSGDGTRIAFTATTNGGWDCYVVDPDGGTRRLTWLSARRMKVSGWLDAEHILLCSDHEGIHRVDASLYSLSLDGKLRRLPWGIGTAAAVSPSGKVAVASANFRDPSGWKRYRGGMAARLYVSADGKGDWRRILPDATAGLFGPTWIGERLVFTSDLGDAPDVQAQVWSVNAQGRDLRQHTSHTAATGYVRDAVGDGQGIVYHARGRLYHLASLKAEPQPLELTVPVGRPAPVSVAPSDRLEVIVPDHGGDSSLVEWRGAAYLLTHRGGPARALADVPGVRIREPRFLGQSGRGIWVSDADGEDCLEVRHVDGSEKVRRLAGGRLGRVLAMEPAPVGPKVAVGSHDGTVYLVDTGRGSVKRIGRSTEGEPTGFTWSPDARYLVWRSAIGREGTLGRLVGYDVTDDKAFTLTRGQFNDFSPTFSHDGRYLCFLSSRTIDPTYDELGFDLSFTHTIRPWVAPLSATEPAPFGPAADGWPISEPQEADEKSGDEKGGKENKADDQEPAVVFDVDGFEDRMIPLPVPSGRYTDLQATKDALVWQNLRSVGELGAVRAGVEGEVKDTIERFSFKTRKGATLVDACDSAAVTGDGERLVVRNGEEVWVQSAEQAPGDDEDGRIHVDLSRLRRELDPRAEWRQMFEENARLMRDHFWREDFDGVDWAAAVSRYRPLLDEITTHDDLVDVLWECVGELNTSHAYVDPPAPQDPAPRAAFLGAEYSRNAKGEVVIERVLPGETSDPSARSPLRAAGVAAQPGDVIIAVDGHSTADVPHIGQLLLGAADKVVELTMAHGRQKRRVAVVPIAHEASLRYHAWVSGRVDYVTEHTAGRLGYIHVPDMVANGWAEFTRLVDAAMRCEGLIVDVRFNGGGHTSELVIERLARRAVGWMGARHHDVPITYPSQARRGPVVFITNPFAGSDGDIVTAAAQNLGLGPVVGERSWGGVVGIDGRFALVDGTEVTQPRYWTYFDGQGFGLENHGVDPDIPVEVGPAEWESDSDVQLDAAIAEALRLLEASPAVAPPSFDAPRF